MASPFAGINTWVFDLDNTLYHDPQFVADLFQAVEGDLKLQNNLTDAEYDQLRDMFSREYNWDFMQGFIKHPAYELCIDRFRRAILSVDHAHIATPQHVIPLLDKLTGRRIIMTDSVKEHANRMMQHLMLGELFEHVDTVCQRPEYRSKKTTGVIADFSEQHGIATQQAVFVEDSVVNLQQAKAVGYTTVLVHGESDDPAVDHSYPTLLDFLHAATQTASDESA